MARIKPALVQRHSDPLSADTATQALCRLAGVQYQVPRAHTCCIPMLTILKEGQVISQRGRAGHSLGMWMRNVLLCRLQDQGMHRQHLVCSGALIAQWHAAGSQQANLIVGGPAHIGMRR